MTTRISSKGQIVLPAEIRHRDHIESGQEFEIKRVASGKYLLVRYECPKNAGLVDWLLGCPEKGYFESITSESTDTL